MTGKPKKNPKNMTAGEVHNVSFLFYFKFITFL